METLDRAAAVSWAAAVVKRANVLYLDTETTGLGDDAEIVDIAVIDSRGQVVLNTLVRPSGRIPRGASDVHGIDDQMVANAPTWPEVYPMLAKLLRNRPTVVIYNAAFDTRIINQVNRRHRLPEFFADWQCAMLQYGAFDGEWNPRYGNYRWHKLGDAAGKLGVPVRSAHRALADTEACRGVVHAMASIAPISEASPIEVTKSKPAAVKHESKPKSTATKRQWTPSPARTPDMAPALQVQDRVFHHQFGYGRVTKVRALGGDYEVTVEFVGHREKRLLASLAKLERLTEDAGPMVPYPERVSRVDRSMLTSQQPTPPQTKPAGTPSEGITTMLREERSSSAVPDEGGTGMPDWLKIVAGIVAILWILGQVC